MKKSEVISVRITEDLKKRLDALGIDYAKEIQVYMEDIVHRARLESTLENVRKTSHSLKKPVTNSAAEIIRKDRENGH